MTEWPLTPLGAVLTQVARPVAVAELEAVPFAGARWYAGGIYARAVEEASKVKTKSLNRLSAGDVTYNRMWATKAAFGVVGTDADGCLVTNDFPVFEADCSQLLPEYMALVFGSATFQASAALLAVGTTERRRLKERDFLSIEVALPSVAAQRRMVDLIQALDNSLRAFGREVSEAEAALSALRAHLLAPQSHWRKMKIRDVATTATGRAFPDRFQGVTEGTIPYFKVSDMGLPGNERRLTHAPNWLTDTSAAVVKPRVCPPGTVVFPIIGAALMTEKRRVLAQPSAFDQNVMGLVLREFVTSEYMLAVMSNVRLADLSQTGAVPSVNQALVGDIDVWVPPLEEQVQIGATLDAVHLTVEALGAELSRLRTFRTALLGGLLSRDIAIPESYDQFLNEVA